jgi:hypothetical protein
LINLGIGQQLQRERYKIDVARDGHSKFVVATLGQQQLEPNFDHPQHVTTFAAF